jgi:hypothetical protein
MIAAVLMAIREINSKQYVKFTSDSLLPNTRLKITTRTNPVTYTKAINSSVNLIQHSFGGNKIDIAIGAIANNLSQAMSSIFQDANIAQIGYNEGTKIFVTQIMRM